MAHRRSTHHHHHHHHHHSTPLPISHTPPRKYTLRPSPNSRGKALGLLHPTRSTTSHARRVETQSEDSDDHDDEEDDDGTSGPLRPVLAALHQNLRRLPSRLLLAATSATRHKRNNTPTGATRGDRDVSMRDLDEPVQIGTKRKRVASSNENVGGHSTRGSRLKRIKAAGTTTRRQQQMRDSSSDDEMEVDTPTTLAPSDDSDAEEDDVDSSDDHLLTTAPARQLLRLRKDELVCLYTTAGLAPPSSFDSLTKPEIVDAIIAAREDNDPDDDLVELPPSSPRAGSECSSEGEGAMEGDADADEGNVAGGEETDVSMGASRKMRVGTSQLRRRATVNELGRGGVGRPVKGRSLSMGQLGESSRGGRRRTSTRSSPTTTTGMSHHRHQSLTDTNDHHAHLPSPPATRTRSRKVSNDNSSTSTSSNGRPKANGNGNRRSKGKAKQVEFSDDVEVQVASPLSVHSDQDGVDTDERGGERSGGAGDADADSELTDLAELDEEFHRTPRAARSGKRTAVAAVVGGGDTIAMPSPRRLRSKSKDAGRAHLDAVADGDTEGGDRDRRVTPMRKAKGKIVSLREDSESVEEGEEAEENMDDDEEQEEEADEEEEETREEEIDELASSPSPTPPPLRGRRTPVKRRLRPRRVQTYTPPSDGDDEDEEEGDEGDGDDEGTAVDEDGSEQEVFEDAEEGPGSVTPPRKLRSGRIVGEEEGGDEEESVGEEEAEEEFVDADEESIDVEDTEEEDTDEPMEDDIDLMIATTKTLVRLRRDDLVRLCETRDLDAMGTKPQLASALLQWRDRQSQTGFSSPSSTGTIRPPSTIKRRRKSSSGGGGGTKYHHTNPTTPVLLRSHHFHADEPRTPPMSGMVNGNDNGSGGKDQEPELELDLESLGLEDREIPPEKLTKLEKIGSGGFKDVFIGKLKGRKVAISEFRGQLSAMDIKELKLLGGFDHPNIVRFLGVSIPENTRETPVMMISELCANGDLFDYVRNVHPPSLHKVLNMMLDIARGLEYLHLRKPSVIHRDCKSSNILITSRGTAKIADFGLAKVKQSTRSMVRSLVGTVNWQAPELWHAHPKYNHKVDVFSCAMVYWEILQWHLTNKKFPWEGMNEHAIYDIVGAKRQRPSISGLRKVWCPEIVDLIERMWAQEHQDRPTMSEVVKELEHMVQR